MKFIILEYLVSNKEFDFRRNNLTAPAYNIKGKVTVDLSDLLTDSKVPVT